MKSAKVKNMSITKEEWHLGQKRINAIGPFGFAPTSRGRKWEEFV